MKKGIKTFLYGVCALAIGFINGFFGGGGGMLCVPLLEKVACLETKKAHATAIPIILPITIASAIVYLIKGYFPLFQGFIVGGGVVVGGIGGALLLKKLPPFIVSIVFSVLMMIAGIRMLF